MSWPAVVLWALLPFLLLSRGPALLYMTLIVNVFGSLQMLPGDGGGVNLQAVSVYAAALVVKVALTRGNVLRAFEAALDVRRMGLFTAFIAFSILGAVALPRIFAGLVEVIPVSGASLDGPSLVQPSSGNLTQPAYMTLSYLTGLAVSVIGSREEFRRHFLRALIVGALALIITGLADLVTYRLGLSALLDPFRTANYKLLIDAESEGAKRVVGLTPEASSFGSLCMLSAAALLLLRPLYRAGAERVVANLTLLGVLIFAFLSTSATAIVGAGVLAAAYAVNLGARASRSGPYGRGSVGFELGALPLAALAFVAFLVFEPNVLAPLFDLINSAVLEKSGSQSYIQRSLWTQIGLQAFKDSGGLGVGLGSVRTSNWVVSILASTGVIGGALIFGFVGLKIIAPTRDASPEVAYLKRGLRLWLLPALIMSLLSGTIPDIGVMMSLVLGLLSIETPPALGKEPKRRPNPVQTIPHYPGEDRNAHVFTRSSTSNVV